MVFSNHFITNCPQNVSVKNWKSVNIWRRYRKKFTAYFLAHPTVQLSRTDGLRLDNMLRKLSPLYSVHVDRQSSLLCPAFYSPANYPLSRTFLPQFISSFLLVTTPPSRTTALPLFTNLLRCASIRVKRDDDCLCVAPMNLQSFLSFLWSGIKYIM